MKFKEIQKIVKEKENIKLVDKSYINNGLFDSIKNKILITFLMIESFVLYPLIINSILSYFTNDIPIPLTFAIILLSAFIILVVSIENNKHGILTHFFKNFYSKKIIKNNIKLNSNLGKALNKKLFSYKKIIKVKDYFNTLNETQQNYFCSNYNYNYSLFLYENISIYIENNDVSYIKNNKNDLTDILINELLEHEKGKLIREIENKLKKDKEVEKSKILNIFESNEEKEVIIQKTKKIIKEI